MVLLTDLSTIQPRVYGEERLPSELLRYVESIRERSRTMPKIALVGAGSAAF